MPPTCPQEAQQGGGEPGMLVNTGKLVTKFGNHSPESLLHLLQFANEPRAVIEEVEMMALVDNGSHISDLTKGFCLERGLKILPLRNLMECCFLRGWGHYNTIQDIHRS